MSYALPPPRFHLTRYAGVLASNAALRAEVVPGRARAQRREDGPCEVMQRELFGEKVWQFFQEKQAEKRPTRHPLLFCAMALAARVRRGGSRVRALCRQVVPRGDCDGG